VIYPKIFMPVCCRHVNDYTPPSLRRYRFLLAIRYDSHLFIYHMHAQHHTQTENQRNRHTARIRIIVLVTHLYRYRLYIRPIEHICFLPYYYTDTLSAMVDRYPQFAERFVESYIYLSGSEV